MAPTLHLFGSWELTRDGLPLPRTRTRKEQWLLALLALRDKQETERRWLAGTLWPDVLESQALLYLRRSLNDLRHVLGADAVRLLSPTSRTLRLDVIEIEIDVLRFDAAMAKGDPASLEEAVALYRGALLEGCDEEWALQERQTREQRYQEALETLARDALAGHTPEKAVRYLRRLLDLDPLHETAQRTLMRALADMGDYAAVTQVYRDFRLRLHEEMQVPPSAETTALYQQFREQSRQSAPSPPPLQPASPSPISLPRPLTSLIGRNAEKQEVESLLRHDRLVTLTGTGGVGKTRLAIAVAEESADDYPDGVWFVDLAPLADARLVASAIATVLGIREEAGRSLNETLLASLKPRSLLLILDNCEHVLPACANLAEMLLSGCATLRVLATSRQLLGLTGERVWRVPSLPVPEKEGVEPEAKETPSLLLDYPAVSLFVERAMQHTPHFRTTPQVLRHVAEICRRLDGIPLAIELAAAWVRALPVAQIVQNLDDRFALVTGGSSVALPRHQTLEATLEWSYDLLSEEEQILLCRLAVFAGGCTLEAAEWVRADEELEGSEP